ncbi:ATP-binding cassette domain-containing protein [Corynebacterium felinum]|uniref:Mycobactin import ATP-binding/permease protein IrtA n=1 Tax=Corynebacterium felinum TaxID=131318 RepID=A0ABU2B9V6_9CORY|nr:ATP-binding cassette domain-containing protein [Corynebacterium felinum]MDF5821776.1 ATP-binding cassette domain-containing protein [Corynebacterium felinum]MDR7355417.1 ATP-binding cassette subfamily B protein IrtA [Corynebacterium felinum]WJY94769.1 Iron import ATP-binding/permease protein IrtA [Corynebacterium felinum]
MSKGFQGAVLRALGAKEHRATVTGTSWIAPHVKRVDFHSPDLLDPQGESPSAWVRGWFPDPFGKSTLHQRGYTFLESNSDTGEFSIAFLIHDPAGPASQWAITAQVGEEIVFQRYGSQGFIPSDPPPAGYLLVGDAASWPAISSIIASLPSGTPIKVLMELFHEQDRNLPFPTHPDVEIAWIPTREDSRALLNALSAGDYHGWRTWVAAETTATRLVRQALQIDHGQNKGTMYTQAYWVHGKAMGKQVEIELESEAPQPDSTPPNTPRNTHSTTPSPQAGATHSPQPARPVAPTPKPKAINVLRPARLALIAGGVAQGLLSLLEIAPLVLFAELARRVVAGAQLDELLSLAVIAAVIMAIGALGTSLLVLALHVHDVRFSAALRARVLRKLTRVPLGWFRRRQAADVKKVVQDDVGSLHYLVTHAVPDLVAAVVTPVGMCVYLFTIEWRLGVVLLVPVITYVVVMVRMATSDKPRLQQMLRFNATLSGDAQRFIAGQNVARVFGDNATVNLPRTLNDMRSFLSTWQLSTINAKAMSLQLNRPMTVMVLLGVAGTALISAGWMPAADLIPFLIAGTSFGHRLVSASYAVGGLQAGFQARASLELVLGEPELAPPSRDPAQLPAPSSPADIRLHQVSFGYGSGQKVVEDVSLALAPGTVTAIVGPSGAGKSTIAALVARLWDPDSGSITLDGVDLRDIPEGQLHSHIALVLQDVQLVRGTIFDNIALGHPDATRKQVIEAARAACIDQVIAALPQGYDTVVDRDSLSGGQRQRLAIARALLGNPRAVILDEATAAADPDSEWAIRQGLNRLLAGRTVLVIAHRLHTIAGADSIVVLDQGRVVEQGTDASLRAQGGVYAQLVASAKEAVQ